MEVKAIVKNVGFSQKKTMIPALSVKGLLVNEAIETLKYMNKGSARVVMKALMSARANAIHNNNLDVNNLYVKNIRIDKGIVYKRFKPAGKGGMKPFIRPHSNILVVLEDTKPIKLEKKKKVEKVEVNEEIKEEKKTEKVKKSKAKQIK